MYQANQAALNQQTNISLVDIRQQEINYFASFFSSFGIQCFFLCGILAGSVSQTPSFNCAENCSYFWQYLYNISCSSCIAVTAIELLIAVFISVYAQGLAIRGKEGSMISSVLGMISEQERVVQYFAVSVVLFQTQLFAMFFIVADQTWAIICGIIILMITYYMYRSALRIYNVFKWDFKHSGWNYDRKSDHERKLHDLSPDLMEDLASASHLKDSAKSGSPLKRIFSKSNPFEYYDDEEDEDEEDDEPNTGEGDQQSPKSGQETPKKKKSKTFMGKLKKTFNKIPFASSLKKSSKKDKDNKTEKDTETNDYPQHPEEISHHSDALYMEMNDVDTSKQKNNNKSKKDKSSGKEKDRQISSSSSSYTSSSHSSQSVRSILNQHAEGYLTVYILQTQQSILSSSGESYQWIRYYFILKDSFVFYYSDRQAFQKNPSKPLNTRPIDLEGYQLYKQNNIAGPPFEFSLKPLSREDIRKEWKFRSDTISEEKYWLEKLSYVLSKINK
jgi:hypothetical protein